MNCRGELPPHARRILQRLREKRRLRGTTSACAENTLRCAPQSCCMRNYLRMRGEYYVFCITHHFPWELPPHARRIPHVHQARTGGIGTTSACAENTPAHGAAVDSRRNYLRMRGEYGSPMAGPGMGAELPPHARRIQPLVPRSIAALGTTSACAENTSALILK